MSKKVGSDEKKTPHCPSYARALKRRAKKLDKSAAENFTPLIDKAQSIEDPYYTAMALSWIGRRMMELGLEGEKVFSKAIDASEQVPQEWRRLEIMVFIEREISKTGAESSLKLIKAMKELANHEIPHTHSLEKSKFQSDIKFNENRMHPNIVLGLFNTYVGKKLKDAHIRAVARAVPLCVAYGYKLCLFNFPLQDTRELALRIENQTLIKDSGKYVRLLIENDRLIVMDSPNTSVLPDGGLILSTTSKPDTQKRTPLDKILKLRAPLFYFLIGLGSSGLPKKILNLSNYHIELTGNNISLETCTAMGVLAANINAIMTLPPAPISNP
jgi:hypothetical protein